MAPLVTSWAPLPRASALGLDFGLPKCSLKVPLSTYTPSWSPSSATALDSARIYCGIPNWDPGPDMPNWAMASPDAPIVKPSTAAPMIGRVVRANDMRVLHLERWRSHLASDFGLAKYKQAPMPTRAKSLGSGSRPSLSLFNCRWASGTRGATTLCATSAVQAPRRGADPPAF